LQSHLSPYGGLDPEAGEVECLSGACLLVRRSCLGREDLFDETFFMYLEDADLCRRLARKGYKVWYEPRATVVHLVGQSTPGGYRRSAEPLKSLVYYFAKHHGRARALIVQLIIAASVSVELPLISLGWLLGPARTRPARANKLAARWNALGAVLRLDALQLSRSSRQRAE